MVGIYRGPAGGPGRFSPLGRRGREDWPVPAGQALDAEPGDLVLAGPPADARPNRRHLRVLERLGRPGEGCPASLLAIRLHDIPDVFPPAALAEAEAAGPCAAGAREDLRHLPLVTIDEADARDFDDAIFAALRADGGFDLVVAIADVAHYVHEESALDAEAARRGTSVYFPDRVVPMLPEALSNGWCSLKPGQDRPVLAIAMTIDAEGRKRTQRVLRGVMRAAARLTYAEAEGAFAAGSDAGLPAGTLAALYAALGCLAHARAARGALDLDLPEPAIVLDAEGRVAAIAPRPRLASHRLVEEFMILANVAAAEALEAAGSPCIYRIHDRPPDERQSALRAGLAALGLRFPASETLTPRDFSSVLGRARGTDVDAAVKTLVLRSQAQAEYATGNIGHFGLGLARYAHFTAPIRRYPDLLVHRALIRACGLGEGGLATTAGLEDAARDASMTERRALAAERDSTERFTAQFMADQIGRTFESHISGVTRFGIFATVLHSGASGLVPMRALPDDFWILDDAAHTLTGRHSRTSFRLGQPLSVRLLAADALSGHLVFGLDPGRPPATGRVGRPSHPWRRRHGT